MLNLTKNKLQVLPLGDWRFHQYIGERIDIISNARLHSKEAWDQLYPQTEEVFRKREDDTAMPGKGIWSGEFWGKYILSVIASCRYYSSDELKQRIAEAVDGLLSTQDQNGYIGTYRDSSYFSENTWNIWCRKYTLWGLIEAWELLGDRKILSAAERFMDHLISEVGPGQFDIIQTGKFYGLPSTSILKPVVMLYNATKNKKYLDFALHIVQQWSEHPEGIPDILNKGIEGNPIHTWFEEPYTWAKSYEFISCVEGLLDLYRVTGNDSYFIAVTNIYDVVVQWERSNVGSISFNDKFIGSRFLINMVAEVCDAVYWNRLSHELFLLTGEEKYMDEMERTLYNALLCAMNPDGTWGIRRLRCSHEHISAPEHFIARHHCCVDNLPRGLFQSAQSAIFTGPEGLYIGLYQAGTGKACLPSGQSAQLSITGDFMENENIDIAILLSRPETFELKLRLPEWSKQTTIYINDVRQPSGRPGSWLTIRRTWNNHDTITLQFDMSVYARYFNPDKIASNDPIVEWSARTWANLNFVGEDNMQFAQKTSRTLGEVLPHEKAVMFCKGPVVLARDIRLGQDDIFSKLPNGVDFNESSCITRISSPEGIRYAYRLDLGDENHTTIMLCDFSSAGNTWNPQSEFTVWNLFE